MKANNTLQEAGERKREAI